jgi:hypothetical protein
MLTADDCLRAAWQALLRGDAAERDRLCALAENLIKAGDRLAAGGPLVEGAPIKLLPDLSGGRR